MTEDYITVMHGSLTLKVPRSIFIGQEAVVDEKKAEEFRNLSQRRYPWLSDNAMDVILRNARKEMLRILDEESGGRSASKRMASEGKYEMAIEHLKEHLEHEPNDADGWYALGELLCKAGRTEEGYKAMNRGRSLI